MAYKWLYFSDTVLWAHLVLFTEFSQLVKMGDSMSLGQKRNLENFLTSNAQFLFIFGICVDHCEQNLFLERNLGVTECLRSLNPRKAAAMAIFPIIVLF